MLIIVLWATLGIVAVTLLFADTTRLEYQAADNALAGLQAEQAIAGTRHYLAWVLENIAEPGRMPDIEEYQASGIEVGEGLAWLIGRGSDDRARSPVFSLVDECSKLNLNTATQEMLETLPRMTPDFAAAIIDWRDADSDPTPGGAESETYLLRDPRYPCKNSPFETVEELHLVQGATWDILYGEDINGNGVLDSNEDDGDLTSPDDNRNGQLDFGILEYLTVYSREPNQSEGAAARRNVNEDSGPGRPNARYASMLEYYIRSGMAPDEFMEVEDTITVSDEPFLEGLVNVNTASEQVLSTIPGIGAEYAQSLVAHREGLTDALQSIIWVLDVLDEESAIQAGPYITDRSHQYSADIAAVGRQGRGFRREMVVFDTSSGEAKILYRRNRADLGWPLTAAVRETLVSASGERGGMR